MASMSEITFANWQIAMSCLLRRDSGAHAGDVGRLSAFPQPPLYQQ